MNFKNVSLKPAPRINADAKLYWKAAAEDHLIFKCCQSCAHVHFPPRYLCPQCWSENLQWIKSKGLGTVYSLTIMRRAPMPEFETNIPYVVALVDLDEGPRMMANIVGENATDTQIGQRVAVCFEPRGDGMKVPQFHKSP